MKILILDNYDSFTYNLVHYVKELTDAEVTVARNDQIELDEIGAFTHLLLSPGPGVPQEAGRMNEIIQTYGPTKNIFGVCLGMQAIGEVYGATLENLDQVFHGIAKPLKILQPEEILFSGVPDGIMVGRYHSWVVSVNNFPDSLEVTAVDTEGRIMAIRHKTFRVRGVQFHPESVLTAFGKTMVKNWLYA